MSKIASNESYSGNTSTISAIQLLLLSSTVRLRKTTATTDFLRRWNGRNENDDIYDPYYTNMQRVAFTSEFKRGKLSYLVALLSGRNFETKKFEDSIAEQSFGQLKARVMNFINETYFKRLVMIIHSADFVEASLIGSQNTLNFVYILYLTLRVQGKPPTDIETAMHDQGFDAYTVR